MVMNGPPNFRVVIPARYHSTRLPGKPLRDIAGRPMIEHTYSRARESGAGQIIIATDDHRIRAVAESFGAEVCMTSDRHASGTDRLAEVADRYGWHEDDIVVNMQGDEPQMPPALLLQAACDIERHGSAQISTLCVRIHEDRELFDPHVVKVVRDAEGFAMYFSRAPIPWHREKFGEQAATLAGVTEFYRHLGIYAYRAGGLRAFAALAECDLERTESLEQLRALWYGVPIHVAEACDLPPVGVDTEEDLIRVNAAMCSHAMDLD